MNMNKINKLRHAKIHLSIGRICILIFVALAYLSYSIPMIHSYFESVNFIYVNAWDEETYLSYQGALGSMTTPGYWASGTLVYILHNVGISGAEINLLFDCLLTPAMFGFLVWSFKACGLSINQSLFYSVILLFSPILFNFGNPLVAGFFSREYGIFGFGFEPYQSILRTPEPQLSYFFIALSVACYIKTKHPITLLIILPILYFYVAISYAYFLVALFAFSISNFLRNQSTYIRITAACFLSYLLISAGFTAFDYIFLSKEPFLVASNNLYIKSHTPIIPLAGILSFGLLLTQTVITNLAKPEHNHYNKLQYFILLSILFISNIHVISGVMLSYKNYMDYAIGFMGGISIIIFIRFCLTITRFGARIIGSLFAIPILILTFSAYGFNINTFEYTFFRGLQFKSAGYYKFVSQHPMSVIIPDSDLSAKIPYSVSKMPIPIFSYQYNFPFIAKGCGQVLDRMIGAVEFLKTQDPIDYNANKTYLLHSIEMFSGRQLIPLKSTDKSEQSLFCKHMATDFPFQTLKQDFKDNGWLTIKVLH